MYSNAQSLYYNTDGQKIAKKLSQQVSKETNAVKTLLKEYYSTCSVQPCDELTISDALDPSVIAVQLERLGATTPVAVSSGKKREAIDAYLLITRSSEEIALLEKEMQNVVHFYENRETMIVQNLTLPSFNQFERGRRALLCKCLKRNNALLIRSRQVHSQMVQPSSTLSMADDSDESDLSDDDDSAIDFSFE